MIPVTAHEILNSTLAASDRAALRRDRDEQLRERGNVDELVASCAAAYPVTRDEDTEISEDDWRAALMSL